MQKNNKFHILQSFDKNREIVVLHCYHENSDKSFVRNCQYVGEETKRYRHVLRKRYVYKLPASVFNYNSTRYDFCLPKIFTNSDLLQINDVIISFKGAFDKINNLLKPSNYLWNNKEKTSIWKEQLGLPQQTFVEFALANYRKKLLSDFLRKSYILYNKSNVIEESFKTEINKLVSVYGSISYFGKKLNEIAEISSSRNPLEFDVKKNAVKNSLNLQLTKVIGTNITLIGKEIHRFSITKTGKKKKTTYGSFRNVNI